MLPYSVFLFLTMTTIPVTGTWKRSVRLVPLPAGTYEFTLRVTGYPYLPCDFGPWE